MQIPSKLKKVWDIASTVIVVIVVLFAVLLVGVRLFGVQVYSVISGSMEPEYPVGALIYVKDVSPYEVEEGDVITYVLPNDMPSTHRVIKIDEVNQHFYTKGDANETADGPVHFKNLIGKPIFKIPYLGYIAYYIQHPPGMYIAIAAGALLLILVFLPDLLNKDPKKNAVPASGEAASPVESMEKAEDAEASEVTSLEADEDQTQG